MLREKLIKVGEKVVHHAGAVTFQLAEVAVPRALFAAILARIGLLRAAPGPGRGLSRADGKGVESRREEDGRPRDQEDRPRDEWNGAVRPSVQASGLPTAPNLAVFPFTRGCGRCPMRVQENRARSRTRGSTLIWEIPAEIRLDRLARDGPGGPPANLIGSAPAIAAVNTSRVMPVAAIGSCSDSG
jgi:hypothetical protein